MQPEVITVWINGEPREVSSNQTVSALLDFLEVSSDRVAVEMNKCIIRNRDWASTQVPGGARIEVVEFVGGG
jgi:sulfur carrier protein